MTATSSSSNTVSIFNRRPDHTLFPLGQMLITPGARDALHDRQLSPFDYISRHWQGDWGDLDAEDVQANRDALIDGTRLLSSYVIDSSQKLWIITEADRSATTLLLPEEY